MGWLFCRSVMEVKPMREEIIFTVQESPEGGYEARALGESIFTYADTLGELRLMIQDAVDCHFDEEDRPALVTLMGTE